MKKLISLLAAAVICCTAAITPVFAADKDKDKDKGKEKTSETVTEMTMLDKATICFDNDSTFDKIITFGAAELTGLNYEITTEKSHTSRSLMVSQDFKGRNESMSGFYFTADTFGLETFAGSTIELYVYAPETGADDVLFYTDGDVYLTADAPMSTNPFWKKVTLEVPDNIANYMFGMVIQNSAGFSDVVCYIDDVCIYKPSGEKIENIGDYREYKGYVGGASSVLTVIAFVLLVLALIGSGVYLFIRNMQRYR